MCDDAWDALVEISSSHVHYYHRCVFQAEGAQSRAEKSVSYPRSRLVLPDVHPAGYIVCAQESRRRRVCPGCSLGTAVNGQQQAYTLPKCVSSVGLTRRPANLAPRESSARHLSFDLQTDSTLAIIGRRHGSSEGMLSGVGLCVCVCVRVRVCVCVCVRVCVRRSLLSRGARV